MELEDNKHGSFLFIFFISRSVLPQAPLPSTFTKALFGWNNQQQSFNEPGFMPVMILALAPGEFPPALIPVFPQLHATNNESVD